MIQIKVQAPTLKEVQRRMKSHQERAPDAMAKAMNRAIANVKTNMGRKAAERFVVKQKDVKATIQPLQKATKQNLNAAVESKTRYRMNLYKMRVNPKQHNYKRPPSVYAAQVLKSGSRKALEGNGSFSKAFVATMGSHTAVWQRTGERTSSGKERVRELYTLSAPEMIGAKDNAAFIKTEALKVFWKRLDHEIKRIQEGK